MLVQLLSVPVCTDCTITVERLTRLRDSYPDFHFERMNMADRPDLAVRYGLLSFEYDLLADHALVIDGALAGIGHPSEQVLRSWLDRASSAHAS